MTAADPRDDLDREDDYGDEGDDDDDDADCSDDEWESEDSWESDVDSEAEIAELLQLDMSEGSANTGKQARAERRARYVARRRPHPARPWPRPRSSVGRVRTRASLRLARRSTSRSARS
tara:strand:+ start:180 stop:536 length:357 start_codon:yes stop_codon:yes gene_type:complete